MQVVITYDVDKVDDFIAVADGIEERFPDVRTSNDNHIVIHAMFRWWCTGKSVRVPTAEASLTLQPKTAPCSSQQRKRCACPTLQNSWTPYLATQPPPSPLQFLHCVCLSTHWTMTLPLANPHQGTWPLTLQ